MLSWHSDAVSMESLSSNSKLLSTNSRFEERRTCPLGAGLVDCTLQETAIVAAYFGKRVASHFLEARRAVDDRVVIAGGIGDCQSR